jgi:hypothetical protein
MKHLINKILKKEHISQATNNLMQELLIENPPKQIDTSLKYAIDIGYRDDPELRKDILQSIDVPKTNEYIIDAEHKLVKFTAEPEVILKDYIERHSLGKIEDIMSGGNGIAALMDSGKVIKITGDKAEHAQAQKLIGKENEYIVNVFHSHKLDTPYYTKDSKEAYLIVLELIDHPTKEEERTFNECCCREDNPILVDFTTHPKGEVTIHPPTDGTTKCRRVYDDLINISKEVKSTGRRWTDIGVSNLGIKNNHFTLLDLGTNDPLSLDEQEVKKLVQNTITKTIHRLSN